MPQICSTNYVCTPQWFDATYNLDTHPDGPGNVIISASGPHAQDVNMVCWVADGNVQIQTEDPDGNWFTPGEASYTVTDSTIVRIPRANMPNLRIIATQGAKFYIEGAL